MLALVFTDLVDSTALKTARGDAAIASLISRHTAHVKRLAADCEGRIIDWAGDGCFLTFETSSAAVLFALRLQQAHAEEADLPGVRIGIHMGEVTVSTNEEGAPRVAGLAVDLAARISGLAKPGQVLMSAAVYDSARQRIGVESLGRPILWQAHGTYALKGFDKEIDIGEAGMKDIAPLTAPTSGDKAKLVRRAQPAHPRSKKGRLVLWLSLGAVGVIALVAAAYFVATAKTPATAPATAIAPGPASGAATMVAKDAAVVPTFGDRPAIAVLPFDNFSPDADQAFFADGLAEDLITRLASWRAFPVISRNSSFKYRGGNLDIKSISAELGARYLVEGSVRREGDQIRVTAQLIDASTGEHVWAEKYDRDIKDVFAIQDEISGTIAASLVNDLSRAEAERARSTGTGNLEAWGLYQLGVQEFARYTREGFVEAKRLYEQAATLDPRFATALAELANTMLWEIIMGWSDAPEKQKEAAYETARRAVDLDPRDAIAHGTLSFAYMLRDDVPNALDSAKRSVDLNPSSPAGWNTLAWAQQLGGNPEASIVSAKRSIDLNPQGTLAATYDTLYWAYWETRRHDESLAIARRTISERSDYFPACVCIAANSVELGRLDEARAAIAEARRIQPNHSLELVQNYFGVSRPEIDARRNAALRRAGLE